MLDKLCYDLFVAIALCIYGLYLQFKCMSIKMPSVFALHGEYIEHSLLFLNMLSNSRKKYIYVDCSSLKNITEEAFIIFHAIIEEKESLESKCKFIIIGHSKLNEKMALAYNTRNLSKINEIASIMDSPDEDNPDDLFKYLHSLFKLGIREISSTQPREGIFNLNYIHKHQQVAENKPERSQYIDVNLIAEFTTELKNNIQIDDLFEPLYDLLVELVGNAAEHGIKNKNINWWLHRYLNTHTQSMNYIFVDMGGGIINSYMNSTLFTKEENVSEKDILVKALKGKLGSTTRQPGRGNGMPLILENIEKEWISNFFLITNSVSLRYINESLNVLETPSFTGTYYSWTISKKNYLQWKNTLSQ